MADFVHLHNHSEFSLLDGLNKIKEMVKRAKEVNQKAIAITDHGSMYGVIKFYQEATKQGIKPIIGCEIYVAKRSLRDKEAGVDKNYNHLILLAENNIGYKNLMRIVSVSYLEGYYYKPRTDLELLAKYHEGLICLSACVNGYVTEPLVDGDDAEAERRAIKLNETFGQNNFFLEVQHHIHVPPQEPANKKLLALSKKLGIPIVATNDNHYTRKEDAEAQEILLCIQTQSTLLDKHRKLSMVDSPDFYIKSSEEMEKLFIDTPEAIENAVKIADRCNVEITLGKWHMPVFDVPNGLTPQDYLQKLVYEGAKKRYPQLTEQTLQSLSSSDKKDPSLSEVTTKSKGTLTDIEQSKQTASAQEIKERIDYELSVIFKKGYETYFLVVSDFVNWAKDHGIAVGPGRGSAAGSVVGYCLRITDIDPFFFKLPFERFLNPLRPSAPDIDLDFADTRREEVIKYVTEKYGEDKVAQIITFGTMEAKGSVKDGGRAMGMSYVDTDRLSKMIPPGWQGHAMTLENAMQQSPDLKRAYDSEPETKRLLDVAQKLEGVARHSSVHAAGVVIADKPLTEYTPVQRETNGDKVVTQYDMYTVGEDGVGLLKMDFLGLRNLTIIEETLKFIKQNQGKDIDFTKVNVDDPDTYKLLSQGETTGIFQLESAGMRKYIKELKPTTIFDLMAMVALYRPGPMQAIPEFIARKHGRMQITYPDPRLETILKPSYGILAFQDDVLLTAIEIAGYTWLDADKFRKAMGKKIPAEMKKQEEQFIAGAMKNGLTQKKAQEMFALIAPFAGYGFNKCITADTIVTDADTGKQITVGKLYRSKRQLRLLSLNNEHKLEPAKVVAIQENGIKEVFEVITRRGLRIKATDNHPFLTFQGFKQLKTLKVGDRLGTARIAPLSTKPYRIAAYRLAVLGYLLAEGNFCHPHGVYFYSTSQEEITDFISNAEHFNNARITINTSKPAHSVYIGRQNLKDKNELFSWIRQLKLYNKKATQKAIPDFVFQLDQEQLSLLLAKMWQGDGCITIKNRDTIFYATSSEKLAYQMQHLLLKLGIISSVYQKSFSYRGKFLPGFTIYISRYINLKRFSDTIGKYLIGDPERTLQQIISTHAILSGKISHLSARGSKDIIPATVLPMIKEEIYKSYASISQFADYSGLSVRLFGYDAKKIGYLRESINYMVLSLQSKRLESISNSDIYWDEIISIEKKQPEMTYDVTISETHNFVANDFIVHNSHAACYATIAFRTAYLKAHFPVEFMAALLTAESRGTTGPAKNEKIAMAVAECKRLGVPVLPPNINNSESDFSIEDNKSVRFGLTAIKNVGGAAVESILLARKNGLFKDLSDFCNRVNLSSVNKKTIESLIKAGALDMFGKRASLLICLPEVVNQANQLKKQATEGQASLFGDDHQTFSPVQSEAMDVDEFTKEEKLMFEKELLGFYLTSHPQMENLSRVKSMISHEIELIEGEKEGTLVKVGGIVESMRKIFTKKTNAEMAFLALADEKGASIDCVIFPRVYEQYKKDLLSDHVVLVEGKLDLKNDKPTVIANRIMAIDRMLLDASPSKTKTISDSIADR